jgi:hypothetical protein
MKEKNEEIHFSFNIFAFYKDTCHVCDVRDIWNGESYEQLWNLSAHENYMNMN